MSSSAESSDEDPNLVVIPIDHSLSDGDSGTWPTDPKYAMPDDSSWRTGLAEMWLKKTGAYEEGVLYIIDSLPEGYGLFDRPRGTNPQVRDRFLFGHPSGIYFQSRTTFFLHFYYLMTGRTTPCPCVPCNRPANRKRGRKSGPVSAPQSRNGIPPVPGDGDGPDYYRILIMKLKQHGTIDEKIEEPLNMDWQLTHRYLDEYFVRLTLQPSFVPRRGETVLWTPSLKGTLAWNDEAKCVQEISDQGEWLGVPDWRAGVVTQISEEETVVQDIVQTTEKKRDVNYSGFRVETLPYPLDDDKSLSLHYKYVPLKCIKPFNCWEIFLQTTPREKLHPSIENALTTMSSWSLLDKYRFKGTWPNASIYSKGIFIGAEMLALKDVVRLRPTWFNLGNHSLAKDTSHLVTEVMVIEAIRLDLNGCIDDPEDDQLADLYSARISGKVYTLDKNRPASVPFSGDPLEPMTSDEVVNAFQSVGMNGYGRWYRVAAGKTCTVSQDVILGRCAEPDATELQFGDRSLGHDLHGVLSGRRYSSQADARIPDGKKWFWGDYRVETLGLATMNGVECGPAAEQRSDPKRWQAIFKIAAGQYSAADLRMARLPGTVGRPSSKAKSVFAEVGKMSKLVSTGLGGVSDEDDEEEDDDDDDESGVEDDLSELGLSEGDLTAPIPFRGGTEESEGGDYSPGAHDENSA